MEYVGNSKAHFDYSILETIEAGMVLFGHEVKSIRTGKMSIKGSYVKILGGEAYLVGAIISPYQAQNTPTDYDQQRARKLLLSKKELEYILTKSQESGLTILPLKVYNKKGLIKLLIGIGKGKKRFDKRETIIKRETEKKLARAIKTKK